MFDVGFTELMLIGIVALVVIGPERLPAVARTAGQWISKLKRFVQGVKTDLASELESGDLKKLIGDQREQINELKTMVSSARQDFESSAREVAKGTKQSLEDLESTLKETEKQKSVDTSKKPVVSEPEVDMIASDASIDNDATPAQEANVVSDSANISKSSTEISEEPTPKTAPSLADDPIDSDRNGTESGR